MKFNSILLPMISFLFLISCGEEKKKDAFEDDQYIDIMGAQIDTVIANSGFRMKLPSLYKIEQTGGDSFKQFYIHPIDPTNNKSSIKIYLGTNPDTAAPSIPFEKTVGEDLFCEKKCTWISYKTQPFTLYREYVDDWNGKKLMIEEITTNAVEAYNMEDVKLSIQPDSTSQTIH